jgi:hypothetical protein
MIFSYVNWTIKTTQRRILQGGDKIDVTASLIYCKQVYATCFDLYLGHHLVNSIKHKLSFLNLVALIWIHIMQFFVVVIITEQTLKNARQFIINQNYCFCGLFPSSSILENRKHNVSETGSVSVFR